MQDVSDATYHSSLEEGQRTMQVGSVEQACLHLERARALAGNPAERTEALCWLARAHTSLGQHTRAEPLLHEALNAAGETPELRARVHMHLGVVRWLQGRLNEARLFLSESQAEFKQLGRVHDRAVALGNLGAVQYLMGAYQPAIAHMQEAIELHESLDDQARVVINSGNLAECYLDLNENRVAIDLLQHALDVSESFEGQGLSIEPLRLLGRAQAAMGRLDEALALVERALWLVDQHGDKDLRAQALTTLAQVRLARGDPQAAVALTEELQAHAGDVPYHRAQALLIKGRCCLALDDSARALQALQEGLMSAHACFSQMLILQFHAALGQLVRQPAIAGVHRRIALELAEQVADALEDPRLQASFRASALMRSITASTASTASAAPRS